MTFFHSASTFLFVSLLAACSPSSTSKTPVSSTPDAATGLTGAAAFTPTYQFIDTQTPYSECGDETTLPSGGYGALALWISDLPIVGDGGVLEQPAGAGHLVRIEVAGPTYIGGAHPDAGVTPSPMTLGNYSIAFEGEDDDDLCMLTPGNSAILDVFDFTADGSYTQSTAFSGTVTFTELAAGHVAGSFTVQLSSSPFTATSLAPFSGTFEATSM